MSLMLNALKRIEAKQTSVPARNTAELVEPIRSPSPVALAEPIELPLAFGADSLPSLAPGDIARVEPASLEAAMEQLQAFVSEAGLLYDSELKVDAEDLHGMEHPVAAASPSACAIVEATATPVDEISVTAVPSPITRDVELDGPGAEFTEKKTAPEVEPPVVAPVATDPYATTAQQILRQLPRGRSQVLLFTSPADGHGKTSTLARLTPLLAQGVEGNVLVVDANFRNPDMARWLAVAPGWRLPDVLAGVADWAMAVQTTAHERVSLLPGGADVHGRGLVRNVQGVSHLFRDLAGHYDLVVVDASSLAHRGTVQLAAVCDATYLVVRVDDGSPRMLREAAQILQRNGGRLLGCVAIA